MAEVDVPVVRAVAVQEIPFTLPFCSDHISTVSVKTPSVCGRCSCIRSIRWREVTIFFLLFAVLN